jgi:hypothetical protein
MSNQREKVRQTLNRNIRKGRNAREAAVEIRSAMNKCGLPFTTIAVAILPSGGRYAEATLNLGGLRRRIDMYVAPSS